MKNYFTISEFAKLRDININSLRYYEKMGLLKPAIIDENNGYRYYSAEQVSLLNKIILCIQLGIPLKDMVAFLDEDGNLESQKLLEQGRIVAKKRIQEMQNNLDYIEYSLKNIEDNREFVGQSDVYSRYIEERKVILTDYFDVYYDMYFAPKAIVSEISKIYKHAQKKGMFPILPAGQIFEVGENGSIRCRFFLEVLNSEDEENVITIPKGRYSCLQVELDPNIDLIKLINDNWEQSEKQTFIISNVMLEKYSFESRPSELQKVEFDI